MQFIPHTNIPFLDLQHGSMRQHDSFEKTNPIYKRIADYEIRQKTNDIACDALSGKAPSKPQKPTEASSRSRVFHHSPIFQAQGVPSTSMDSIKNSFDKLNIASK